MFKALKAKNKNYRATARQSKRESVKKLVGSGQKGVHRSMSKASGTSVRSSSRYMGGSTTLKWRSHDLKFGGGDEVAEGVSKTTAEVSAGDRDDLSG